MKQTLLGFLSGLLVVALLSTTARGAEPDHCAVCGRLFGFNETVYTILDKVTHQKVFICPECAVCPDECYICGLPVRAHYIKLADGRFLCARDGKDAVLDEQKAKALCEDVVESLNRMFSRFLTVPSTNCLLYTSPSPRD